MSRARTHWLAVIAAGAAFTHPAAAAADGSGGLDDARRAFPGLLGYDPQSSLPDPTAVSSGPLAPRSRAAGMVSDGQGQVLVSSAPLSARDAAGQRVPLSLTLEPHGTELAPQAAPLTVRFGSGPAATQRIGPDEAQAAALTPTGLSAQAQGPRIVADKAYYADERPDTDTLLTQQVDGIDRVELLRSAQAPEILTYKLTLPPGQSVRLVGQDVVITDATGATVTRALAPRAFDAQMRPVPSTVTLSADELTVAVSHRAAQPSYPVAVAMTWTSQYDWEGDARTGFEGWGIFQDSSPAVAPGPYYEGYLGGGARGPGIQLNPIGGRLYDNADPNSVDGGPRIIAQFDAPGTTTIRSARFSHVDFRNELEGQIMRLALYGPGSAQVRDIGPPTYQPNQTYLDRGPFELGPTPAGHIADSAQIWLRTVCAPDTPGGPPTCPVVAAPSLSFARVGAVFLTLNDTELPDVTLAGTMAERRWTRGTGTATVELTGTDPGSGIRAYALTATSPGRPPRTIIDTQVVCPVEHTRPQPTDRRAAICPATDTTRATDTLAALPEGTTRYRATATDLSGQDRTRDTLIGIDRTAPRLSADGALLRAPSTWANLTQPITLSVVARDALSGVQEIHLDSVGANGRTTIATAPNPCSPTSEQCPRERRATLTVDPAQLPDDGSYRFELTATDLAANTSQPRNVKDLKVDREAPTPVEAQAQLVSPVVRARWTASFDKRSGVAGYLVRSRLDDGPWTTWQQTTGRQATRTAGSGQRVLFEVRARDRAGNLSVPARAVASANVVRCDFTIKATPNRAITEDAPAHRAKNTSVGFLVNRASCGPNVVYNSTGRLTIRRAADNLQVHTQRTDYVRLSSPLYDYIGFPCNPNTDGQRRYVVTLSDAGGSAVPAYSDKPVPLAYPGDTKRSVTFRCPSTSERQTNEFEAWKTLSAWNTNPRRTGFVKYRRGVAGRLLRQALGDPPTDDSGAWEAHHIVPAREPSPIIRSTITAVFRCGIFPNDKDNGVYLRSRLARRGTTLYGKLGADGLRTWHPLTYGREADDYFVRLRRSLRDGVGPNGSCRDKGAIERSIEQVQQALVSGDYVPRESPL